MTKAEIKTVRNIIDRLQQPRLGAAVGHNENVSRLYVDTWLVGPLRMLLPESRDTRTAAQMSEK